PQDFAAEAGRLAARLSSLPGTRSRLASKKADLERQETIEPLSAFRARELAEMHRIFHDPDAPYHALRRAFARKEKPRCTPPPLARARAGGPGPDPAGRGSPPTGRPAP